MWRIAPGPEEEEKGHKEIAIEMQVALSRLIAGETRKPADNDETCLPLLSRSLCTIQQNLAVHTLKGSKTDCAMLFRMGRNEWEF